METEKHHDDLEILEVLKDRLYRAIMQNQPLPKLGDLLKVIDMKNKLSVSGKVEKKFWEMIDKIREQELSDKETTQANESEILE